MTDEEFADGREPIRRLNCDDGIVVNVYLDHNQKFEAYVDGEECRAATFSEVLQKIKQLVSKMQKIGGLGVPVTLLGDSTWGYTLPEEVAGDGEPHAIYDCYYRGEHASHYSTSLFSRENGSRFNLKHDYQMTRRLTDSEKDQFLDLLASKRSADARLEKFLETFEGLKQQIYAELSDLRSTKRGKS